MTHLPGRESFPECFRMFSAHLERFKSHRMFCFSCHRAEMNLISARDFYARSDWWLSWRSFFDQIGRYFMDWQNKKNQSNYLRNVGLLDI